MLTVEATNTRKAKLNLKKRELIFDEENKKPIKMFKLSVPNEEYQSWKDNNKDGYGAFTFKCAEKWAELMELEMGMALSILKKCWKYGNMLPDSLYDI